MRNAAARLRVLAPAFAVVVLGLLAAAADADPTPAPAYYLSLGDSLARGWQPDATGHNHESDQGYVDVVAAGIRTRVPNLRVVKLGCPGETTQTMLSGGRCRYAAGSQLAEAERFLAAHRGRMAAVSVNVGDNDLGHCLHGGRVHSGCVDQRMAGLRDRLPQVARRLAAAAGPDVPIAGLADYDEYLAYWMRGRSGRRFARRSIAVIGAMNTLFDHVYADAGIAPADAGDAFHTSDLARPRSGAPPAGVRRICAWTWACSDAPIGFNDHANARGYRVLGRVVLAALRS